jgi:hypothetical protein
MLPGRPWFPVFLLVLLLPVAAAAQDLPSPTDLPFAEAGWQWSAPRDLTPPELVPAGGTNVAAASNGSEILVVWESWRRILAARVAADGTLIGRAPIVLGTRSGPSPITYNHQQPQVAWNGERYLVVWEANWFEVEGQFVSRDGRLLGAPMALPRSTFSGEPLVASNRETFLVAAGNPVALSLVSSDGFVYRIPGEIRGSAGALASDGESYLLLTSNPYPPGGGSESFRISRLGGITTASRLAPDSWTAARWSGTHYFAADDTGDSLYTLDRDGRSIGDPLRFGQPFYHAAIEPLGADAAVVALGRPGSPHTRVGIHFARVEGDSVLVGPPAMAVDGPFALAAAGGRRFFFCSDAGALRHARFDDASLTLEPAAGLATALAAPDQREIRSTATTHGFFAVWNDFRADGPALRAATITRRGDVGEEVHVANGRATPAVASSGEIVFVSWFGEYPHLGLWGRRFTAAGDALDAGAFQIAADAYPGTAYHPAPGIAWDGEAFVVAWMRGDDVRVTRITAGGVVVDPGGVAIPRPAGRYGDWPVALASTGGTTLLVWQEGVARWSCQILCTELPPPARTFAVRVDRDLVLLDAAPFELVPGSDHAYPTVAANEGVFLIAAFNLAKGPEAIRLGVSGPALDVTPLDVPFNWNLLEAEGIEVAPAPGGFLLVASASAPRDIGAISYDGVEAEHMRMQFVPLTGAPAPAIPLRDPWFSLPRPDVSVLPDGTTLVLYSGWRHDVGVTRRVAMQMLTPPAAPRRRTATR